MTVEVRTLVVTHYDSRRGVADAWDATAGRGYSFSIVGLHGGRANRYPQSGDRVIAAVDGQRVVTARYEGSAA